VASGWISCQYPLYSFLRGPVDDTYLLNERPIAKSVNKELRLLATLPIHVIDCIFPDPSINGFPVNLVEAGEIVEPSGKPCNPMTVGENKWQLCLRDILR